MKFAIAAIALATVQGVALNWDKETQVALNQQQ